MKWLRYSVLWLSLIIILGLTNGSIWQKEQLITHGEVILLQLAPVDPRSLMQGDYMRLGYAIASELRNNQELPSHGQLVIKVNSTGVATYQRLYQPNETLANDERLLNYHQTDGQLYLGAESFFFQEGQAQYYQPAKYGELRLTPNGESVLVGLRDENLKPLTGRE